MFKLALVSVVALYASTSARPAEAGLDPVTVAMVVGMHGDKCHLSTRSARNIATDIIEYQESLRGTEVVKKRMKIGVKVAIDTPPRTEDDCQELLDLAQKQMELKLQAMLRDLE